MSNPDYMPITQKLVSTQKFDLLLNILSISLSYGRETQIWCKHKPQLDENSIQTCKAAEI